MKAALFDLDGVLIDTEPVYSEIWSDIESHFPTGTPDFAKAIKGTTLPGILNKYFRKDDHQAIVEMLYEAESTMQYPLFPQTMPFLKRLKVAGIPAAIVTSSGDVKMERLFSMSPDLKSYFGAIITDSHVSHGKPDPECYLLGAKRLGINPADCVVFEDSFNGLKAGRAAGAYVVGIATTNLAESLADFADIVVDNLDDDKLDSLFQ